MGVLQEVSVYAARLRTSQTAEQRVADPLRIVALRLEHVIETSHRPNEIDANALLVTLLSVAEKLDPPVPQEVASPDDPEWSMGLAR